LSGRSRI